MELATSYDVVVIGGGAAGMMCAAQAGQRGRSVLLVEHCTALGEKIRISGGGRCNFTNRHARPGAFLSNNPHFSISALQRYSAAHFIKLVEQHGIGFHEKKLGQLFCNGRSDQIISLLKGEMARGVVEINLETNVDEIAKTENGFALQLSSGQVRGVTTRALVIATGGKSIPKMGASGFGYKVAEQFGLPVIEPRPGLVPLTFDPSLLGDLKPLAGVSVEGRVLFQGRAFDEALLFTHRGLSGPAILQISSFWREGRSIEINLLPDFDFDVWLAAERRSGGGRDIATALSGLLPKRLAELKCRHAGAEGRVGELKREQALQLGEQLQRWGLTPVGTEGYRTAEVTVGGVDTAALSSKTMEARHVPGLYFIGEVVDVTGWLGGYNFQWAWSSAVVAGQSV